MDVGKNVTTVKIGDRVAVDPNLYCGKCSRCRNEQSNQCLNLQAVGVTRAGAFAEYVTVPERACYPIPDSLTDKQGAFIEPLACVVYALRQMRVKPADRVLIVGVGPMGLLLVQDTGAVQVDSMVTHRFPLAEAQTAFNKALERGNVLKVMLHT